MSSTLSGSDGTPMSQVSVSDLFHYEELLLNIGKNFMSVVSYENSLTETDPIFSILEDGGQEVKDHAGLQEALFSTPQHHCARFAPIRRQRNPDRVTGLVTELTSVAPVCDHFSGGVIDRLGRIARLDLFESSVERTSAKVR